MQWTEPSCILTTALLLPLCCDRSEWCCHGFRILPLYMTSSSWPFRTNCPYLWCSASRTHPSTLCDPSCWKRKGSSRCVSVCLCGLLWQLAIEQTRLIHCLVHFRSTWGWWVSATGSTGAPGSSCSSSSSPFQSFFLPCWSVSRWVCVTDCHHLTQ